MCKARFKTLGNVLPILALVTGLPALAQTSPATNEKLMEAELPTTAQIEERLNAASLCTPLQFDLRTISALLGVPIPAFIPIDTSLRWDQSRHSVTRFASSPTQVELDFKLGCQPSTNGVALEFFGLSPDKVRLDDDVKCVGDRTPGGDLGTLACRVDSKIGRFLSQNIIGLSARVGDVLPMNLAVPADAGSAAEASRIETDEAAPSEAAGSATDGPATTASPPAGPSAPADAGTSAAPARPGEAVHAPASALAPATAR